MNYTISQKFQSSEDALLISGSIVDVMNDFRNITKQAAAALFKVDLNEFSNLSQKIFDFSKLHSNWDSYNAEVISNEAIKVGAKVIDYLNINGMLVGKIKINVFPMRDGGIQLEFDGEQICAELEIDPKGVPIFILFDNEGNIVKKKQLIELSELITLLEEAQYA